MKQYSVRIKLQNPSMHCGAQYDLEADTYRRWNKFIQFIRDDVVILSIAEDEILSIIVLDVDIKIANESAKG
jgi:hypothetical protein